MDINGTIRAENYENFELTDLPIGVSEEPTYDRNRVLKVKDDGSGYELVDIHELDAYKCLVMELVLIQLFILELQV